MSWDVASGFVPASEAAKLHRRIAQLEAGLARIKSLTDAPDLHNSTEEADRVMEWAVNEAEAALKETT